MPTTIEDLPADLFGDALLHLSEDAVHLATASEVLMQLAAHTIAPWEANALFHVRRWNLRESTEVALLRARNAFVAEASLIDVRRWPFTVRYQSVEIPVELAELHQLTEVSALDLSRAQVDISWFQQARFAHLTKLSLGEGERLTNEIIALLPQVAVQLTSLDISKSRCLTATCVESIAELRHLRELSVIESHWLTDGAVAKLGALPELQILVAAQCDAITGAGLSRLHSLTSLNVHRCRSLSQRGLADLGKLAPHLTDLDISDAKYFGIVLISATAMSELKVLTKLRRLNVAHLMDRRDETAILIADSFKELTDLDVSHLRQITDAAASRFGSLHELQTLRLNRCTRLTDATVAAVADGCPKLQVLELGGMAAVTDASGPSLAKLKELTSLDLQYCDVTDALGPHLAPLVRLTTLNLTRCTGVTRKIADSLPHLLRTCTIIVTVKSNVGSTFDATVCLGSRRPRPPETR